jgi:hypothetical protein
MVLTSPKVLPLRYHRAWIVLRWAAMVAAIFWTLVYRIGANSGLPEFVYVNF